MESTLGKNIKVTIFGGSHEPEIGCHIEGFPKEAMDFDHEKLQHFLDLRAPGNSPFATRRKEPDRFEIREKQSRIDLSNDPSNKPHDDSPTGPTSDLHDDSPTGPTNNLHDDSLADLPSDLHDDSQTDSATASTDGPLTIIIKNTDQRSGDYKQLASVPRPGHADYTARIRYGKELNMAGGGPFSARMTAPLCIAGSIALQFLESKGIRIGAHLLQAGSIRDTAFDPMAPDLESARTALELSKERIPAIDPAASEKMAEEILRVSGEGDSIGGIVEVAADGIPAGLGGAMYDGLESLLSPIYFGIPAVKGIEFGAGFSASAMKGSENNDAFTVSDGETGSAAYDIKQGSDRNDLDSRISNISTKSNNAGGILGGISTGMPFIARIAFKPTPSISKRQGSVNIDTMKEESLSVKGRHDPCVAVRAVPIVIAATALGLLDAWQG